MEIISLPQLELCIDIPSGVLFQNVIPQMHIRAH